jgi:DNA invertase Pin-like site-specific DNA recombinase
LDPRGSKLLRMAAWAFACSISAVRVDTKSATGKLILTIFAGFAQFEREMMLERQREGIAKAKAENRYMGRRPSARLKAD